MAVPGLAHVLSGLAAGVVHTTSAPVHNVLHTYVSIGVNAKFRINPPGLADIIHGAHVGVIPPEAAYWLGSMHGVPLIAQGYQPTDQLSDLEAKNSNIWAKIYEAGQHWPTPIEILTLWNRQIVPDDLADTWLKRNGYEDENVRNALKWLRYEIPGPSDLVRFAVRHVFEPSLALRFGFDAEMSQDFVDWHKKQGFGQTITITDPTDGKSVDINWAMAHWWAHWIWPSPGQGYTMLQQLRPGRHEERFPDEDTHPEFTNTDLNFLLRGNDYPPHFRPYLAAISYRTVGLRQITGLLEAGVDDDAETTERFRDLGFPQRDAERMAQLAVRQVGNRRWKRQITGAASRVINAFRTGTIKRDEATSLLYLLELNDADEAEVYLALPPADRYAQASQELGINLELDSVEYDVAARSATASVRAARKEFLAGHLSAEQARHYLEAVGIVPDRVLSYLETWQSEFTPYRKELQTGQIGSLYVDGIISGQAAAGRLGNLGWVPADIPLLLLQWDAKRATMLARQRKAAEQQAAQLLRDRERRAARVLADKTRAARGHGTKAELKRWVIAGYISPAQMHEQLLADGYPADAAAMLTQEAVDARDKKQSGSSKKKAPVNPGTGP